VSGLLVTELGKMLRMEEAETEKDEQGLHQLFANSKWDERKVVKLAARDVDAPLSGQADSCLILAETGFPKKGELSGRVAQQ